MMLEKRRATEINFWRDSISEGPEVDDIDNQLDKSADAYVFREALRPFESAIKGSKNVLELGAGQGWASCVLKRIFPHLKITISDISEHAIASRARWERIYNIKMDGAITAVSDKIPVDSESIDFVFCFAAAHHFVTHEATLLELSRILRPGGMAIYFYEPTSPRWLYRLAVARVNRKRPDVPEDVLVPRQISRSAQHAGLTCKVHHWPSTLKRGKLASFYYTLISAFTPLSNILPCTAHFQFNKPMQ
jgi:ubiquinone/menaquinone biosynthesis C-methylase UbiE